MDNRTTNSSSVYMFEGHTLVDRVLMLTGPSTGLIVTICSSIVLNTFLKELNSTIKILFNILLVHNFIIFVTGISTVAYAIITENQTTELCIIHYHTTIPSTMVNFESMNILSIIRYYLTWKTQNKEYASEYFMIGLSILCFVLEHLIHYPLAYVATKYFDLPSLVTMCNGTTQEGSMILICKYKAPILCRYF